MNAQQSAAPWAGHTRMALRLSLGFTKAECALHLSTLMLVLVLPVLIPLTLLPHAPMNYALLAGTLALPAGVLSARSTRITQAALHALWLAPSGARQQCLNSWKRMQTLWMPGITALGVVVLLWQGGTLPEAACVIGTVVLVQGLCAVTASAQSLKAGLVIPVFFALLLLQLLSKLVHPSDSLAFGLWLTLAVSGAALLRHVGQRLQSSVDDFSHPLLRVNSVLSRLFYRYESVTSKGSKQDVSSVWQAIWNAINLVVVFTLLNTQKRCGWELPIDSVRAMLLLCMILWGTRLLLRKPLCWRTWLMPGTRGRYRLGQDIVISTLVVHALISLSVIFVAHALTWLFGGRLSTITFDLLRNLPLALEWCVAVALATVGVGVFYTRRSMGWVLLGLTVSLLFGALVLTAHHGIEHAPVWGTVNTAYILSLLIAFPVLTMLANVVWSRADLHQLTRASANNPFPQPEAPWRPPAPKEGV